MPDERIDQLITAATVAVTAALGVLAVYRLVAGRR